MTGRMAWLGGLLACSLAVSPGCGQSGGPPYEPYQPPRVTSQPASAGEVAVTPTRDPAVESTVHIVEAEHTLTGVNLRMSDLVSVAYRTPQRTHETVPLLSAYRIRSQTPLPKGRYDVRVYVPGADATRLRAVLAKLLADRFGIVAHRELRAEEVYVLVVPTGQIARPPSGSERPREPGTGVLTLKGDDLALLAEQLEEVLRHPVVDETGLRAPFAVYLDRELEGGQPRPLDFEQVRTSLRVQMQLDLVRTQRTIEFVIVDRVGAGTP